MAMVAIIVRRQLRQILRQANCMYRIIYKAPLSNTIRSYALQGKGGVFGRASPAQTPLIPSLPKP